MVLQYPHPIRRIIGIGWRLILLLNLAEYVLAWARVVYGWVWRPLEWPPTQAMGLVTPPKDPFETLVVAHLGLLIAFGAARAIASLASQVTFQADGLLLGSELGSRFVRYNTITGVLSSELGLEDRFVVWVSTEDRGPLISVQGCIASLLFGRPLWRGFLLSSDLAEFDTVLWRIVSALKARYGEATYQEHFVEVQPTALVRMLSAPFETIRQIAAAETVSISLREAGWQVALVAVSLSLPLLVGAFIHLHVPWGALILPLVAMLEWPLVSAYLLAIGEGQIRRMTFQEAMRVYPLTQLPRWAVAVGMTLLVVAGAPLAVFGLAIFAAIAIGSFVMMKLTEEWFNLQFPSGLIGVLATAVYQIVLYGIFIVLLPR